MDLWRRGLRHRRRRAGLRDRGQSGAGHAAFGAAASVDPLKILNIDEQVQDFAKKDDLENLRQDLKQFAKKDDLKDFAKKEDLEKFATKDDLKQFAKKEDLNKAVEEIIEFIGILGDKLKEDVSEIKEILV